MTGTNERTSRLPAALVCAALLLSAAGPALAVEQVLSGFEAEASLGDWGVDAAAADLVTEGVTQGTRALQLTFDPALRWRAASLQWRRMPVDWSGWDALIVDVFNPGTEPLRGGVLVGDRAWEEKGSTYWNRHNGSATFAPGHTKWVIPIGGLYRGEAGSRNNDIPRNIDADNIVRLDLSFGREGQSGRVIVDNIRLVRSERPDGVWAFDFGPPDQSVMMGWTGVSNESAHAPALGYGWVGPLPWNGAARDTTFGTVLLRDFCEGGGYRFRVEVPPGRYRAIAIYENCGYWGGEQAKHSWRRMDVNGQTVWNQERPDGAAHPLYRFENVEPIGADLWDTYMLGEIVQPFEFEVTAGEDGLTFLPESDNRWGSKLAALVLHRADDGEAAAWVTGQFDELAREFRSKAVSLDTPPAAFDVPEAWRDTGLIAWPVRMEDTVAPNSTPPEAVALPADLALEGLALRGEYEALCVAVRPLADLGECRLTLEGAGAPGIECSTQVVWYNTSRGFNTLAYRIQPHTVREQDSVALPADVTREIVVTARVAEDAEPGVHSWDLVARDDAGDELLRVPMELTVSQAVLSRDTDFLMGYFGLMPPDLLPEARRGPALERTLSMLREHGMNAVSGGPSWRLEGWQDGRPQIDFGGMDSFFALLKEHGFTGGVNGYGGERFIGLHERYVKGATGERVEQQSGLPYQEALMRAWQAVDRQARAAGWPTIFYAMCDETRVREQAERELEFMKMMETVSAAFPQTVRTSGSYSVDFRSRPENMDDLLYWHQRFFEHLDISSLNGHDETVMSEAARLGKDVHIYNQGRSRYSFGLYQWSEFRKGVKARWQWHLNILHGYQFFDLDGREPDTAMICYGRDRIYPTIHFERCREGAEDFYLYQTATDAVARAQAAGDTRPAVAALAASLRQAEESVRLNQRGAPDGYDPDASRAEIVAALEELL